MDDVDIDVESNALDLTDANLFKRSNRTKKQKKFFDDVLSTKPVLKVKLKQNKIKVGKRNVEDSLLKIETRKENADASIDEEEAWLDALEKGELDDNGEIPKTRDPALMTARQRALLDRSYCSSLVEEISATSKEVETEEEREKRLEKNRKRKLQAAKKAEETQKQTIKKLVEIPKASKDRQKYFNVCNPHNKQNMKPPMIRHVDNINLSTISYPEGHNYPLQSRTLSPSVPVKSCCVCGNIKKYNCSKTGKPLCSLNCYKENLLNSYL